MFQEGAKSMANGVRTTVFTNGGLQAARMYKRDYQKPPYENTELYFHARYDFIVGLYLYDLLR